MSATPDYIQVPTVAYNIQQKRVQRLEEELAALRQAKAIAATLPKSPVTMRVSPKGGVSVYIPGRGFPVTLYKEQWQALLDAREQAKQFLHDHERELK